VADIRSKPATEAGNGAPTAGIPGSASRPHPTAAIPLPAHGFDSLDDTPIRDLVSVPAVEVITRSAVLLIMASADKLGMSPDGEPDLDLDEARTLITSLAGLLASSEDCLGVQRGPLQDGLRSLQRAFREASRYPDEPGQGPGEKYLS
jgi:hypothetical protein